MAAKKKQSDKDSLVYSTVSSGQNPFQGIFNTKEENKQTDNTAYQVRVKREKKGRRGKEVTIIEGLRIDHVDLAKISSDLKTALGTGGAVKGNEIIIQGDFVDRIVEILKSMGYPNTKRSGG